MNTEPQAWGPVPAPHLLCDRGHEVVTCRGTGCPLPPPGGAIYLDYNVNDSSWVYVVGQACSKRLRFSTTIACVYCAGVGRVKVDTKYMAAAVTVMMTGKEAGAREMRLARTPCLPACPLSSHALPCRVGPALTPSSTAGQGPVHSILLTLALPTSSLRLPG